MAAARQELDAQLAEMEANPSPDQRWQGHSYQYWASFLRYAPTDELAKLDVPILLAHGTRDGAVPVESGDAAAEAVRKTHPEHLTYLRFDGLDHLWRDASGGSHGEELLGELRSWVQHL